MIKAFNTFSLASILISGFYAQTPFANESNSSDQDFSNKEMTMVLNYDGFFDRMDDLEAPEYKDIKLAFYLKDKDSQPCEIKSVELKTKQKSLDVYFMEDGELLLPFEPKYDQDKAAIVITKKTTKDCGLNMRLESTQLFDSQIDTNNTLKLVDTFDTAFSDLGGMMSFMLPSVSGVSFLAAKNKRLFLLDTEIGECKANRCTITKNKLLSYNKPLKFNIAPKKAVPFIN